MSVGATRAPSGRVRRPPVRARARTSAWMRARKLRPDVSSVPSAARSGIRRGVAGATRVPASDVDRVRAMDAQERGRVRPRDERPSAFPCAGTAARPRAHVVVLGLEAHDVVDRHDHDAVDRLDGDAREQRLRATEALPGNVHGVARILGFLPAVARKPSGGVRMSPPQSQCIDETVITRPSDVPRIRARARDLARQRAHVGQRKHAHWRCAGHPPSSGMASRKRWRPLGVRETSFTRRSCAAVTLTRRAFLELGDRSAERRLVGQRGARRGADLHRLGGEDRPQQRQLARAEADRAQRLVIERRHDAGEEFQVGVAAFAAAPRIAFEQCDPRRCAAMDCAVP